MAVPAWNGAELLREALASALEQTYPPFEIVVVDDGSTDHTRQVAESFGRSVRYIHQENDGSGGGGARARAMFEATGDWIALLDQDDRWLPAKLEQQVEVVIAEPGCGVVLTESYPIDGSGTQCGAPYDGLPDGDVFHELLKRNPYSTSSGIVAKEVVSRCGLPDICMQHADWDYWLRLSRVCRFAVVRQPLTEYRVHARNFHRMHREAIARGAEALITKARGMQHTECTECRDSLRKGACLVAGYYLAHFHGCARSGKLSVALPSLLSAFRVSARTACELRALASMAKSLWLGATHGQSHRVGA